MSNTVPARRNVLELMDTHESDSYPYIQFVSLGSLYLSSNQALIEILQHFEIYHPLLDSNGKS